MCAAESSKTLTLVTCLYDLVKRGSTEHRTLDWMQAHNDFVLGLDYELVIFTEPEMEVELRRSRGDRPTKIVVTPFEELLGNARVAASKRCALHANALKTKVTPSYVQLMWAKYAMLERALEVTSSSHVGWIDLGISHVAKLPPDGVDIFTDPSDCVHVHVLRCFSKRDVDHPDYWRDVQGHLAGGLVVGRRDQMQELIADYGSALDRAILMGFAPLDEGLLSYIVGQRPSDFSYSYGDYEDILRNHDKPRHGGAHRRWIIEDARRRGLPDTMNGTAFTQRFPLLGMRAFRPAFSPRSCYLLRDAEEEAYFFQHGGAPEADLITWAAQFIGPGQTFVDVGAHIGSWAQHLAQISTQVHAFEPQRSTFERLREGAYIAELDNITCYDVALGGHGEGTLHIVSIDGGGSTLRYRQELGPVLAVEPVRLAQLDDFQLGNVGLIKIDAEGFELDILRGGTKTLEKQRPTLLLEAWDQDWYSQERAQLIAHLREIGYGVSQIRNWPQALLVEPVRGSSESLTSKQVLKMAGTQMDTTERNVAEHNIEGAGTAVAQFSHRSLSDSLEQDRPLLGLVMIVKNEARRVAEVLASYRAHIDRWTILDTGSTDGTQRLILQELEGIPGSLFEEPFVDFATSRNRALALHGTETVFSIMPNGDVLAGGPELRSFLEMRRSDIFGAYRVRITPGHYYHPLVMRTGAGWQYKWRTHECAMGPLIGDMIPGVIVNRERGARTDEEWRLRWERDLDLLNRDRSEDPSDPRPYFYLGQTHECLGQYAQALAFFERRAEMGGYFDEVYEAKFRVAKMKEKLEHSWADIQQAYLNAFVHDPRRAEPLHAIAQHWHAKDLHALTRVFAVPAAEMTKPATDLFLDESVYQWRAADLAAISSYYTDRKERGRFFAEKAVNGQPGDERLRANRAFYAQSALELFGAVGQEIAFIPEPGWNVSNPSICSDGDQVRCIVRTVNYKIVNGSYVTPPEDIVRDGQRQGWQVIRTRNFLLELDSALKTTSAVEMLDKTAGERSRYPVHGFEDARLFYWKGGWHATSTVCDFTEDGRREIALLDLKEDGSIFRAEPLRGPWSVHPQKNWMPVVEDEALRIVYAIKPTTIFTLARTENGDTVKSPVGCDFGHGRLRGGSQGVRVPEGWIFAVHDVAFPGSGRIYLHRFVLLDEQLQVVSMTDPFYFERLGIEFCAGLTCIGDKLVASYAVNDGSARLGIFNWAIVRQALRKDYVI